MNKEAKTFFLISQVFYPDEASTASLFTDLAVVLAREGYTVRVWSAQPSYRTRERQQRVFTHEGVEIRTIRSTNFSKSSLIGRAFNILTFSIGVVFRLLFSKSRSPVFTHSTPPFLVFGVALICKWKKRPLLYVLLDIFPEGLVRLGKLRRRSLLTRLWSRMHRKALKRSTRNIVLGRDMLQWLNDFYPEGASKAQYIPHWQNEELIKPAQYSQNPFVEQLDLTHEFTVQYSGNMGLWNDMASFGKAAGMLQDEMAFVFIGGGIKKPELMNALPEDRKNIHQLPFQPKEKLGEVLTGCHAALVSLNEGLEGMAVPCKIYGILAAGVPVMAMVPEESEIALTVREEHCGYVIPPGDVSGLVVALRELKNHPEKQGQMGRNSRKAFEKKYTSRIIAGAYMKLLHEL